MDVSVDGTTVQESDQPPTPDKVKARPQAKSFEYKIPRRKSVRGKILMVLLCKNCVEECKVFWHWCNHYNFI